MAKDKGTTLPITQLSGLMVNYTDENSTLNPPSMTTVQRNALVNTDANKVNPLLKVKEGTQIYNTDPTVQKVQIMQGGKWVNVGVGAVPSSFNTLVFNNNPNNTGNPIGSVKNQSVVFQGEDGQNIMPAVNANNQPVGVGGFKIEAPFLTKRNQKKRRKNLQSLPSDITGLFGIGAVDFSEGEGFGFVTCEEQQFITLNIQPLTLKQNILLTDDPEDSDPSSPNYNAIVEIRSDVGGFQLPRLSAEILANMDTDPIEDLGLMAYNKDPSVNTPVIFNGETFVPLGGGGIQSIQAGTNITIDYADPANPTISATGEGSGNVTGPSGSPASSTKNAIAIYADDTGTALLNTGVTIDSSNNINGIKRLEASSVGIATRLDVGSGNNIVTLNSSEDGSGILMMTSSGAVSIRANSSQVGVYGYTLPVDTGHQNQVLTTSGSSGNLSWVDPGGITTPSTTTTNQFAVWGDTSGDSLQNIKYMTVTTLNDTVSYTAQLTFKSFRNDGTNIDGAINLGLGTDQTYGTAFIQYKAFNPLSGQPTGANYNIGLFTTGLAVGEHNFYFPTNFPTNGQILQTDGNGSTSWTNTLETLTLTGNSLNVTCDGYAYLIMDSSNNITGTAPDANSITNIGLLVDNTIVAAQFDVISSIGIKNILDRNITKEVCDLFSKIPLVKYDYKDKIRHVQGTHYGVIAEEVREIIPHIVHDSLAFIPNIMCKGKVTYKDPQNIIVSLEEDKQLDILIDKQIQLFTNSGAIYGVVTSNTKNIINIRLDKAVAEIDKIFVYGTKENCPAVAKERMFEMNMVVTQSLLKRIAILEDKLGLKV